MSVLISIIIPIYNSEIYLKKCIESVVNQTYKELEIILLDDGSTDASREICEEYEKKDRRIRLVRLTNKGVSNARNLGLKIATGEYVSFIDSDDNVDPNFIMKMYDSCKKNDTEICVVNVNYEYSNQIERPLQLETKILSKEEYYKALTGGAKGFVTNKMYKKSILNDIYFDTEITIGEDLLFNVKVAKNVKRISILNEYLYNYYQNPKSAYNSTYNEKKISEIYAYDKVLEIVKEKSLENLIFYKYEYLKLSIQQKQQYKVTKCKNTEIYIKIKKSIEKYYKEIMTSKQISFKQKLYILISNRCFKLLKFLKFIKNRVI